MTHRTSLTAIAVFTAAASAAFLALAPASALAAPSAKAATSTQYAGWGLYSPPAVTSTATTFVVPHLACTTVNATTVPGVGVVIPNSIIAIGVALTCTGGAPSFTAESDVNGAVTVFPVSVKPGDKISASLTVSPSNTTGTFEDLTKGFKAPVTGKGGEASLTCVGIDGTHESPQANPVPNFGAVKFSATTIDGKPIGTVAPLQINMATAGGVLQIKTGAINAAGMAFTSKFVSVG